MKPEEMVKKAAVVKADLLTWLAIHGNLCLALRHPGNTGKSRPYVIAFTKSLGKKLVEWGVVTEEDLRATEKLEIEEGSVDLRGMT